ncbi:hypothetical protein CBER1_06980 [Cercospora berteroae]|uniref:Uncharacterized protein n=1 Tax=Cercospora berteroae TaxID=357750 RepID=A0A2S6BSE3_9PEZI|nr:hypothetical protein CBER1_06980 [Cercospora berteroae]
MSTTVFDKWVAVSEDASNLAETNPTNHRLPNQPACGKGIATQVRPRFELLLPGEPIAVDIEFEDFSRKGEVYGEDRENHDQRGRPIWHHRIAWIGVVNMKCETVLDVFAFYPVDSNIKAKIPHAPGKDFGVKKHLLWSDNGAVDAQIVE